MITAAHHTAAAAGSSMDLLSVLIAIAATIWLVRWALRGRSMCGHCQGSGVHRGLLGNSLCRRCGGTGQR